MTRRTRLVPPAARGLVVALGLAGLVAGAAHAEPKRGLRGFGEVGMASFSSAQSTQVGVHISSLRDWTPGLDLTLAMWISRYAVITPDLGLGIAVPVSSDLLVIPHAGGSVLFAGGSDYTFYDWGASTGVGVVYAPRGSLAVRADYTLRQYYGALMDDNGALSAVSVGISFGSDRPSR